jgi:hypothetical protein
MTGIVAAMPGCGDDDSSGDTSKAGESSAAGKDAGAGENTGGTGSVVKPMGGEGGVVEPQAGSGGAPLVDGGTGSVAAGAGGAAAGAGGVVDGGGAGGAGGAGGDAASCLIGSSYGNLGLIDGFTEEDTNPITVSWYGDLQVVPPYRGLLAIELYDGYAPFDEGIKPVNNHVLAGDDLNFYTCGLCVRLLEVDEEDNITKYYMATAGTVSVTSVVGRMTGSASGLSFEEVIIEDDFHSTPVPGGCQSTVTGVNFDEALSVGGAGGAGN